MNQMELKFSTRLSKFKITNIYLVKKYFFYLFLSRLFVVYDKAKDYITKILTGIDEQIGLWQYRRQIIQNQTKSTTSFDFLLPKTQRINELTIDAVQGKTEEQSVGFF
jgi:hypothetical protein